MGESTRRTGNDRQPVGSHDLIVASIAIANDLTVVTHNTKDFANIPGLRIEDWQRE